MRFHFYVQRNGISRGRDGNGGGNNYDSKFLALFQVLR